jgi:transposase
MPGSPPVGIGIDVSKGKLDVILRFERGNDRHVLVPNTAAGVGKLTQTLQGSTCRIVLESTGRFHLLPSHLLSQQGFDVRVINPIIARRYMTASVRKKKMDKADAAVLAQVAALEKAIPRFTATKDDIEIRQKIGLLCALERHLQSLRATRERYREFQDVMAIKPSRAELQLEATDIDLERKKKMLEREIEDRVEQNPALKSRCDLAASIPGVSRFLACLLCHSLRLDCESPKQWIHYVGYDVSVQQSGLWKGHGKLTKRGNPYLRKRLFNAAWAAMMHSEQFRRYYETLRQEGRSYRESLVIIARKLLRILFAVQKTGMPYSEDRCLFPELELRGSLAAEGTVVC